MTGRSLALLLETAVLCGFQGMGFQHNRSRADGLFIASGQRAC